MVQVEDSEGRHIAQGSLHGAVIRIDPPPTPPPETMPAIHEPVYETPDPYLRSYPISPVAELMEHEDGLSMMQRFKDGRISMPIASLYGVMLHELEDNRAPGTRTATPIPAAHPATPAAWCGGPSRPCHRGL